MSTGPGLRPGNSPSVTTRQASPRAARPRPSTQSRTARPPPVKSTGKELSEEDDAIKSVDPQAPLKSSPEANPKTLGEATSEAAPDTASAVGASKDLARVLERLDKLEKQNEALRAQVATHDAASLWVQDLRQRVTSLEMTVGAPESSGCVSKSRSKNGGDSSCKNSDDQLDSKTEPEDDVKQLQAQMASLEGLVVELDESLNHEHLLKRVDVLESGFMKLANLDAKVAKLLEKGSKSSMGSPRNGRSGSLSAVGEENATGDGDDDAPPRGIRLGGGGSVDLAENFNHYAVTDSRVPTKAKPALSSQAQRSAKAKQAKEVKQARAAAKEVAKADAKLQKNAAAAASGSNKAGGSGTLNLREMMALRRGSLRDSSFLKAAESMVVSAIALELTEDERAMNGAPEGALYVAEILSRNVLPQLAAANASGQAREGPEEAVARALAVLVPKDQGAADVPWNESFDALTTFRRVLVHHPEVLRGSPAVLAVVPGIVKCSKSLRSVLAKNALLTVEDLFYVEQQHPYLLFGELENGSSSSSVPDDAASATVSAIDALCDSCLDACASNQPKALRLVGQSTLSQATQSPPHMLCVIAQALLLRGGHKNAAVATQAVKTAQACLTNLADMNKSSNESGGSSGNGASFPWNLSALSLPLSAALNGKDPAGKQAAVACCAALAVFIGGIDAWRTAVEQAAPEATLSTVQLEELAAAGDPTNAVAGGSKSKKGKKASGRGSTFGGSFKAFMSSNKKKLDLDNSGGGSIDLAENFNHYAVTDSRTPTAAKPVLSSQAHQNGKGSQSAEAVAVDVDSLKAVFPADVEAANDQASTPTAETEATATTTVDLVVENEVRELWPDVRIGKLSLVEAAEVTAISVAEGDYSTNQANRIVARLTFLHAEANGDTSASADGASEGGDIKGQTASDIGGDAVSARASSDYTEYLTSEN